MHIKGLKDETVRVIISCIPQHDKRAIDRSAPAMDNSIRSKDKGSSYCLDDEKLPALITCHTLESTLHRPTARAVKSHRTLWPTI